MTLKSFLIFTTMWGLSLLYIVQSVDILRSLRRAKRNSSWLPQALVLAVGVGTIYGAVYQSNLSHFLQVAAPAYILFFNYARRAFASGLRRWLKTAIGSAMLFVAGFLVICALAFGGNSGTNSVSVRRVMKVPINTELGTVYYLSPRAEYLQGLVDYLKANTEPDDVVVAIPEILLIPLLADRRSSLLLVPIAPTFLEFLGPSYRERFFNSVLEADVLVYFENPRRFGHIRMEKGRFKVFHPQLYQRISENFTFENRVGDYIILRKSPDSSGATEAFLRGWESYKYGPYEDALKDLSRAMELGGPRESIEPLVEELRGKLAPIPPVVD